MMIECVTSAEGCHISRGYKATKEQKNAYKAKRDAETAHAAVRQEAQEIEEYEECVDYGCENQFAGANREHRGQVYRISP
jgi:hypothetical protein